MVSEVFIYGTKVLFLHQNLLRGEIYKSIVGPAEPW